ncbi:acetyltransferase [Enterocloster bolteae]|uniref:acetyltransferase n=1 Tax=Enterocloster bolteae TaxID=208479 RepID=UPI00210AFA33|nr:NeuD/PglB/VioB family sugar acetyltransferase [Enterocloster bolteae]MCQ5140768.1 acetyltransferase [Enterocloster bolteae]
MKGLVIIGASGHGRVVADIAKRSGYKQIVFLDDDDSLTMCGEYPVEGKSSDYVKFDCDVFVAIGDAKIRQRFSEEVEENKKSIPILVHPSAVIAENVSIEEGTIIVAGSVINPGAKIGKGCIINTCSSVDHDCIIRDYVHVSVGVHISGTADVGERTWIGAGATVINNINICSDCIIGAGAVVVKDIKKPGIYIGVPAAEMRLRDNNEENLFCDNNIRDI